jgi:hypothetical protein
LFCIHGEFSTTKENNKSMEMTNENNFTTLSYDVFGDIGINFRELCCETQIFSGRVVPKAPNAS